MIKHADRIEMVVLDWAGTAVDFGSMAPILALEQVFADSGVPVAREQLRLSMGLAKKDHIREILALRSVSARWSQHTGAVPTETDVEALYARFTPQMTQAITGSATVIPGVSAFAAALRSRGIKLGATTGYTRPMLDVLLAAAAPQGFAPDLSLCPDDVPGGRPAPWMCYRLAIDLRVSSLSACVKIGDTPSDIAEGRNAGMWTIGVTETGNCVGLSLPEWQALAPAQQATARERAEHELLLAGAHFVVPSAAAALPLLDVTEARLAQGERP